MTRPEAIEGALGQGWIDGQAAPYDGRHWLVRFTPRWPGSNWSQVNCEAAQALMADGRMRGAGLAEIAAAQADGRWKAAYAPPSRADVPPDFAEALEGSAEAKRAFEALDRTNRYAFLYRVQDAKKPETRAKRIAGFVAMLERGGGAVSAEGQVRQNKASQRLAASNGNGVGSQ